MNSACCKTGLALPPQCTHKDVHQDTGLAMTSLEYKDHSTGRGCTSTLCMKNHNRGGQGSVTGTLYPHVMTLENQALPPWDIVDLFLSFEAARESLLPISWKVLYHHRGSCSRVLCPDATDQESRGTHWASGRSVHKPSN